MEIKPKLGFKIFGIRNIKESFILIALIQQCDVKKKVSITKFVFGCCF